MTPEELVAQLRRTILEDNIQFYRELLVTTDIAKVSDPYWRTALELQGRLDDADRRVLLSIIRQTIVDSLSSVFAVIDGVTWLPGQKGNFVLRLGDDGEPLNGELQDLFLAAEEEECEGEN